MKTMLLAAGRSSRLGALGQTLPKPIIPVCGHPAIAFGLAACARAGLTDLVVNLHHRGDAIRDALGDGRAWGVRIAYSTESDLLGTGGGIAHARALLGDGPVLVMNAKVVADIDLAALVAAHAASGADATLVVRDDPDARKWGAITSDAEGRVTGILDARGPRPPAGAAVERMFTGIQIMGAAIRDRLRPVFCDSVRDAYIPALRDGADLRAFVLPGYFAEHSTPERYLAGNVALLRRPDLVSHPPGPLVGIDPRAHVDPRATIVQPVRIDAGAVIEAGATVGPDVVVGAGATVTAGAAISEAVLWPGVRAEGVVRNTVVSF
ncbi:MAG: NDP-sugar synthase [Pseudomonadota bacterium]